MMSCPKCGGLLYDTPAWDLVVNGSAFWMLSCMNCGKRIDAVMLHNKQSPPLDLKGTESRSRNRRENGLRMEGAKR